MLRLRAIVHYDADNGVRFGWRHKFRVALRAVLGIPDSSENHKKTRVRYFTSEVGAWEQEYPGAAALAQP